MCMMKFNSIGRKCNGFTLIEVMIVVTIITLLATIAYPAYTNQINISRRSEATSALITLGADLERFYTASATGTYTANLLGNFPVNGLGRANINTDRNLYVLTVALNPQATTYVLTATPNPAVGWAAAATLCGNFTLSNTGLRGVQLDANGDGLIDNLDANLCWR